MVFPCQEFERLLKERHPKIEPEAAVFLGAALEYICADLLQASGNRCLAGEKAEIIGLTDIVQTMTEDEELSKLFFVVTSVRLATYCYYFYPRLCQFLVGQSLSSVIFCLLLCRNLKMGS